MIRVLHGKVVKAADFNFHITTVDSNYTRDLEMFPCEEAIQLAYCLRRARRHTVAYKLKILILLSPNLIMDDAKIGNWKCLRISAD
jgi:hypothetical protein